MGVVSEAPLVGDHDPNPVYGTPYGFYADGHNPTLLTMNLQQTRVFESTGTGVPSSAGLDYLPTGVGQAGSILSGSALELPIIYPMNQLYNAALTASHVDVTYQVHAGGHDIPDFYNELAALLAWDPFKSVVGSPKFWVNDTVAKSGQLWDVGYLFAQPPNQLVQFQQFGDVLSISAAGSVVTVSTSAGCTISTPTPARIDLSSRGCS
jgi:hypothetical protein